VSKEMRVTMTSQDQTADEAELRFRAAQATRLGRFLEERQLEARDVEADPSLLEPITDLSGEIIPDTVDLATD
jgi:hypothetical protein